MTGWEVAYMSSYHILLTTSKSHGPSGLQRMLGSVVQLSAQEEQEVR